MLKRWAVLGALAAVALAGWFFVRGSKPPVISLIKAARGRLESGVSTNGKVEPIEWAAARAESEGLVESVPVRRGQSVKRGDVLATLEARQARADLVTAEARISQAMAEIQVLETGGRATDLSEIEGSRKKALLDRDQAQRDLESMTRLEKKNAATKIEVQEAADRLAIAQAQIRALDAKRAAMVNRADVTAAQARLRDAKSAATLAKEKIALATIRAPMDGVVYQLDARTGAYLTPGTLVANVGRIDRLRVVVYVDEPELGRVKTGMPVVITWDALPGRDWRGAVDRMPTQIVPLGTRQVGEVQCLIDNPDGTLLPGTNVTALIRSQSVENAITVPRESIVREAGQTSVWVLDGEKVRRRPVQLGVANITRVEVTKGLREGEEVALPGTIALSDGMAITPDRRTESTSRETP